MVRASASRHLLQNFRRAPCSAGFGQLAGIRAHRFECPGHIAYLCRVAPPRYGVVLNVGHAHVAETAVKRLGLNRVIWLVSPQNPLKPPRKGGELKRRMASARRLARGPKMIVSDIEQAHSELRDRGVEVSDVQDFPWGRFVFFSDPDGNRWSVQQIPPR